MDKDDRFKAAPPTEGKRAENPAKGHAFWFTSLFCQLVLATSINAIYRLNPELTVMQLLVLRGVISTAIMVVMLFGQIKSTLIDGVKSDQVPGLTFRIAQGVLSILFAFYSLKYFSPTIYRTTDSMQPLIVVMLSACWLKEGITKFDVVALILAFTASFIIIQASDEQGQADVTSGSVLGFQIALLGLILNPFLLASG